MTDANPMEVPASPPDGSTRKPAYYCCVHCLVVAQQYIHSATSDGSGGKADIVIARCISCQGKLIWYNDEIIFPRMAPYPAAHIDMPGEAKGDYDEARQVAYYSPRAGAALLRVCVERILDSLKIPGNSIDDRIANLVDGGLDPHLQKMLDVLRVSGNGAVHPGLLAESEDPAHVASLFDVINMVVIDMITRHRVIEELYKAIPENLRDKIDERDEKVLKRTP